MLVVEVCLFRIELFQMRLEGWYYFLDFWNVLDLLYVGTAMAWLATTLFYSVNHPEVRRTQWYQTLVMLACGVIWITPLTTL